MKKWAAIFLTGIISMSVLTGCGNTDTGTVTDDTQTAALVVTPQQNDWNGGISRASAIVSNIQEIVGYVGAYSEQAMQNNPDQYWGDDDYFFVDFQCFDFQELSYTFYLNELQDWATVQEETQNAVLAFDSSVESIDVTRNSKHNYYIWIHQMVSGDENDITPKDTECDTKIYCIYDAQSDGMQMIKYLSHAGSEPYYEDEFFEFVDLGDYRYLIQSHDERLYVAYKNGYINSFYYSKLSGEGTDTDEETEIYIPTLWERLVYGWNITEKPDGDDGYTEDGSISAPYTNGTKWYSIHNDSLFDEEEDYSEYTEEDWKNWVLGRTDILQSITYEDSILALKVKNQLTHKVETFTLKVERTVNVQETSVPVDDAEQSEEATDTTAEDHSEEEQMETE